MKGQPEVIRECGPLKVDLAGRRKVGRRDAVPSEAWLLPGAQVEILGRLVMELELASPLAGAFLDVNTPFLVED